MIAKVEKIATKMKITIVFRTWDKMYKVNLHERTVGKTYNTMEIENGVETYFEDNLYKVKTDSEETYVFPIDNIRLVKEEKL